MYVDAGTPRLYSAHDDVVARVFLRGRDGFEVKEHQDGRVGGRLEGDECESANGRQDGGDKCSGLFAPEKCLGRDLF